MPPTPPRTVVGLDLSLTSTGIAVVHFGGNLVDHTVQLHRVQSKGSNTATLTERYDRLRKISGDISSIARVPDLVVIEGPAFSRTTGHMHDRSGLWWLVVDAMSSGGWGAPITEVTPTARAKYATGKGNAGKDAVLAAVVRRYPTVDVTGNDTADALVLAAMGARHLGHPVDDLPKTHLAAMDAVRWPTVEAGAA